MLTTIHYIIAYLISIPIFIIFDLTWLGLVAKDFYQSRLGHLLSESVNWPAAIVFYFIFLLGLLVFATIPALEARDLGKAVLWGALFGFFTYATYDLTNWATLREWPALLTFVDMAWGTLLGALVSGATYLIATAVIFRYF